LVNTLTTLTLTQDMLDYEIWTTTYRP
jgi:hypothetical protein